ncbi:MAG TPA: hypothetical protein VFU93_10895 [Acidimicrobiales bacterium]|nr:hypothetical protein [Acidimicrobiales bacterium]
MKLSRTIAAGLVAGATLVGSAWAGVGLVPISTDTPPVVDADAAATTAGAVGIEHRTGVPKPAGSLVGAAKVSIYPDPETYDGTWERDRAKCATLSEDAFSNPPSGDHLAAAGTPWPENPSCIYMGGYGIGPMNPIVEVEPDYGFWVRSVAIGDGTDTIVLTVIDAEGYLWDYKSKCERCGSKQLAEDLGAELGIAKESFVIAATHSHTAPDLIGGWGFVPDWYMNQVTDAIKTSVRDAVATMRPATIEVGEVTARGQNRERRDTYRSAEEQQLTWLRAIDEKKDVIATVGAYAAHPTSAEESTGLGDPDWIGRFEKGVEERFGGVGLHFMTGLGNMSTSGGVEMGHVLAGMVPDIGDGTVLTNTDLRVTQATWEQPATNVPLTALGFPGFFDREFLTTPSALRTGKSPDTAPCLSTSAFTVELPATAARIGDQFALTAAPGEVFSNLTNTIKDNAKATVTMPLAQANDALGYMPQSFELSPVGQQGLGFVAGGVLIVNYEDSYAIDRCVGDMVLETTLTLLDSIR